VLVIANGNTGHGIRVRPHRKRAAAAGSNLCPRRECFRNVLRKIASSPSNKRRADAADQSRSRRAVDSCVLETDFPGGQYGMAEEFTEKLIEKVREYVFLYDTGHPEYKNLVKKAEAWRGISEELDQTSKFFYIPLFINTGILFIKLLYSYL